MYQIVGQEVQVILALFVVVVDVAAVGSKM
jgi:hypothetical protein